MCDNISIKSSTHFGVLSSCGKRVSYVRPKGGKGEGHSVASDSSFLQVLGSLGQKSYRYTNVTIVHK